MRTEQWIELLARGAGAAPAGLALRRLSLAGAAGFLASAALAIGTAGLLPWALFATQVPWTKLAYCGALAVASGWMTARLSRPAATWQSARTACICICGVMGLVGAAALALAPEGARWAALLGRSWWACPLAVLVLALPALAAVAWAVKGLAPTRPVATGFAAGAFAGALSACGYSLVCPEASPAFVAVWYTLGVLLTAAAGAWLGPRLFRW